VVIRALWVLLAGACGAPAAQGLRAEALIGPLARQARPDGCGCHLELAGPTYVFWNDGTARMNVGGLDTVLEGEQGMNPGLASFGVGPAVPGAQYVDTYRADETHITIEYTVTSVCETGTKCQEHTGVDAVITAERRGRREILTASGACGC
jgi:hypothetical protein